MTVPEGSTADTENRFCSRCGVSRVPLPHPHVARRCKECNETMYLLEAGEGGSIQIREGDRFTIPAGFIKISLSSTSTGVLFRPGLKFLLKQLFYSGQPRDVNDIPQLLERYQKVADHILKQSELLKDTDIDSEAGASKAWDLLQKNTDTREWYALPLGTFVKILEESIAGNDQGKAVWAMYHAATAHAMTVAAEGMFEQTLWRGYLANRVEYEARLPPPEHRQRRRRSRNLSPPLLAWTSERSTRGFTAANPSGQSLVSSR